MRQCARLCALAEVAIKKDDLGTPNRRNLHRLLLDEAPFCKPQNTSEGRPSALRTVDMQRVPGTRIKGRSSRFAESAFLRIGSTNITKARFFQHSS